MVLSDRKKKILQIVVDDYIETAQPVSSKSITEKHMSDISSATVRSELAALEEMGYLSQLHTSSGRVPSAEAYKMYVAELMEKGKLNAKTLKLIRSAFSEQVDNIEDVVKSAAKVISDLTDYTSVASFIHDKNEVIENVSVFRYKADSALLLIVTDKTLIRDKFIKIPPEMTDAQLESANSFIGKLFKGKKLCDIRKSASEYEEKFGAYREIFERIIDAIENYVKEKSGDVFLEGEDKILKHPEYSDIDKVKNFLSVVSDKDKIQRLLSDEDDIEISIKIGGETESDIPSDCSLVTATYLAGGKKLGTYGVLGPLRMDYQKVISVLEGVGRILEDLMEDK